MTPAAFSPKPFRTAPVVFGLVLVLVGLLLYAERTAPELAYRLAPWWPLLVTALGLARLVDRGPFHVGGHILIGFSLILLAASHQRMELVDHYWPLGIVWMGVAITGRAFFPSQRSMNSGSTPKGDA